MTKNFLTGGLMLLLALTFNAFGQETSPKNGTAAPSSTAASAPAPIAISATSSPEELAKAAFVAQGGEKFRTVQNMLLRGSVQLFPPNSAQSIPGSFTILTSGDKFRMDIDARPIIVFKQIFDGQNSYSSMPNVEVPPLSKFGVGALRHYDQPGYKVSALPDKKKLRAFRIVDPDGYTTDFFIDASTARVMSFLIYYNGITLATENSKFKDIDGVLVPSSFSQRFEMPQGAFFAEFSVKDVKLNQTLGEDAFAMPN
jgi:hypothetical protein